MPMSSDPRQMETHQSARLGVVLDRAVFGFTDGLITDMAVVAGIVAAPNSSLYFVVVAAVAATLAGAMSMFLGAYVAAHTKYGFAMRELHRERQEVEEVPETERAEVREIYRGYGFTQEETEMIVHRVTSDKERWVKTMMREELGFGEEDLKPPRVTREVVIGLTYLLGSTIPIIPFLAVGLDPHWPGVLSLSGMDSAFAGSIFLSALALALMGALKERFGANRPVRGAVQMLAVGLGGAAIVYLIISGVGVLLFH